MLGLVIIGVMLLVAVGAWLLCKLVDMDDLYDSEKKSHTSSTGSWHTVSYHDDENDGTEDTSPGMPTVPNDDDDDEED
jgi:hypothetical protein